MPKIIRLTESQLKDIITKIISEQNTSINVQKTQSKTPSTTTSISNYTPKVNPKDWYKNFPCVIKNAKMINGMYVYDGKILLPQSGNNDSAYKNVQIVYKPYNKMVGQVKGGGVYFCSADFPEGLMVKGI